ncbi:hypothetical protein [Dactylosporangium salmoneum]|uniref:Uncharacterized protein n=1 Tax=Dactylosporangium salmoneum TaxID=53361 RepID=A0ABP5UB26_9ACTN
MIQVTRQGGNLAGTLDQVEVRTTTATAVTPTHAAFTGTVDGTAITLTFPGGLGFVTNISGTMSDDTMTLQAPQGDGTVTPVTLKPSTIDAYNSLVGVVQASAAANLDALRASIAASEQAATRQRTEQGIQSAADTVSRDMDSVRTAISNAPDFSGFEGDVNDASGYLQQSRTYATSADSEPDQAAACDDAHTARDYANAVHDEANGVHDEANSVDEHIADVTSAVSRLNDDLTTFQGKAAALPAFAPLIPPDLDKIKALRDEAVKQTGGWKAKADNYHNQVASFVTQADAVAAKAEQRHC